MPLNKNAMTRYMILDELLSDRYHNYSMQDLTDKVNDRLSELYPDGNNIVKRTIEKDIYYLEVEGPFMVNIERYTVHCYDKEKCKHITKKCLRYSHPSFSIFKKELSQEEQYLLSEALSMLGQFDGLPNLDALEKLRIGMKVKRPTRQIISFTKNPLENSNILGELFTVISHQQVIEIQYHKFSNPENKMTFIVHPHLLKEYNRRWFLFATTEEINKLTCFALDRIDKITPLPNHKYIVYNGDINERFEDIIGVTLIENSPTHKIIFWVSYISNDYVRTKPIHESQKLIDEEDCRKYRLKYPSLKNGTFFSIDCKCNYELIRELASFGQELVVLEPIEIQNILWERINKMKEAYENIKVL